MKKITILIHCKDQPGIIAAVTNFIASKSGNIVYIDQHVDQEQQVFFMRLEGKFEEASYNSSDFKVEFEKTLATNFKMNWELYTSAYKPKMALFVSKYDHCLYDILGRYKSGELDLDIPLIVSNHLDLKPIADSFEIPFYHIPITKENKKKAEEKQLQILQEHGVDFIVLARYMQIISGKLIEHFKDKIINIHHSFLPAFPGAKPYHSAYERGVKIIGATSHYVTKELDAGPIIEQNTTHVSHLNSIDDFIAKGRDLERIVLSKALQLHVARKVMVYKNKTIVFS